jgi:serine/threonine-protein kinase
MRLIQRSKGCTFQGLSCFIHRSPARHFPPNHGCEGATNMPNHDADRNLLFGVLALQADLLDAAQFAEACSAWAGHKDRSLAELMIERGWLSATDRDDIERLLERKLKKHSGDVRGTLDAVADAPLRRTLAHLEDTDLKQSLAGLTTDGSAGSYATVDYQPTGRERYTLTRLHARGGIGQVWLAHDADLGRDVALKELRIDRAAGADVQARFLEEARITGQLEHPGIVPVYELVKPAEGRQPFYTMRFVGGRTLSEAVKAYHEKRAGGRSVPLDLRELLGAFVSVCNAVAYAHARGVIHRDLKGQNVILGQFGEVILLDWGLAKVLGRTEGPATPLYSTPGDSHNQTIQGQVLGTPEYMSPEQAEGRLDRIDRRSDIYGLGAILYEILTARPPFGGADPPAVLQKVLHDDPTPPRELVSTTPLALESVCLKALAKDPARRYGSAAEVAREVQRFLADEPVRACREPVTVRLARWGRRHRPLVTAAAALLMTVTIALAAGTLLLGRANAHTERARQEAQEQRDRAEENSAKARKAVDDYFIQVSENKLLKSPLPGLQPLRKELLETALKYYQGFVDEHRDDPGLQAELARAFFRVGLIRRELGAKSEAFRAFEQSRDLWKGLADEDSDEATWSENLAQAWLEMGRLQLDDLGRSADALRSFRQAQSIYERLMQQDRKIVAFQNGLASCYQALARWYMSNNLTDEEEPYRRQALEIAERLADGKSDDKLQFQLARLLTDMGYFYARTGKLEPALRFHARAQKILERLTAADPADLALQIELGRSYVNQGWANQISYRFASAAPFLAKAQDHWKRLSTENPSVREFRERWAGGLRLLADLHQSTGNYKDGVQSGEVAVVLIRKLADQYADDMGLKMQLTDCFVEVANIHRSARAWAAALREYQKVLELQAKVTSAQRADLEESEFQPQLYIGMGEAQDCLGNASEALKNFDKARAWLGPRLKGPRPNVWHQAMLAEADLGTARVHLRAGKHDLALPFWERAKKIVDELPKERNHVFKSHFWAVGSTLVGAGKTELSPDDRARRQRYGDRALEELRLLMASGFRDPGLVEEFDFASLRSREDFQKLIDEMRKPPSPGEQP